MYFRKVPVYIKLGEHIYEMGRKLVKCSNKCPDVVANLSEGIMPRGLILELEGRHKGKGVVIVGINPGHAKIAERNYFQTKGQTYDHIVDHWKKYISPKHKYHLYLRHLVNELAFNGPILWSELVKCENSKTTQPPIQTFQICVQKFLQRELQVVPLDWPLIAVGKMTYNALSFLFLSRVVVGVPHPAAYGQFDSLFEHNGEKITERSMNPIIKKKIDHIFFRKERYPSKIWLSI